MMETRRDFLKFVVAGSVAAGCPVNHSLLAAESGPKPQLDGDHFAICHEVRDGQPFDKPAVSSHHDVVIVGAGWIGLETAAAARTAGASVTVLEPQPGALYRVLGPELGEHNEEIYRGLLGIEGHPVAVDRRGRMDLDALDELLRTGRRE